MYVRYVQKHRRDMRPFVHPSIHPSVPYCLSLRVLRACMACDIYVIFSLDSTPAAHDSRSSFSDREKQRRHRRPLCPALTLRYLDLQSPFVPHAQTTEHYLKPCDATCNRIVVVYQVNSSLTWQLRDVRRKFGSETWARDTRQRHHVAMSSITTIFSLKNDNSVSTNISIRDSRSQKCDCD
jgi:hypothetical protein